jgi:hypothetical protein
MELVLYPFLSANGWHDRNDHQVGESQGPDQSRKRI